MIPLHVIYKNENVLHYFPKLNEALEVFCVLQGVKPVTRQMINEEDFHKVFTFCENYGLHFELSSFKILKDKELLVQPGHPSQGHYFMYISKDKEQAQLAKFYEGVKNDRKLGEVLGYPSCCVDFYKEHYYAASQMGDEYSLFSIQNTQGKGSFLNNNLLRFFGVSLISHFPCSFNCKETQQYAQQCLTMVEESNPGLAGYLKQALKGPVISHVGTGIHPIKDFVQKGKIVRYNSVWMTSPNYLHDVLSRSNTLRLLDAHHVEVFHNLHKVDDLHGKDVGVVVFE
jgi:hypothetical protein